MLHALAIVACLVLVSCCATGAERPRRELRDGRLYVGGVWTFLKLAVPLRNFADAGDVDRLIADLPTLTGKGYNAFKINCYWHHFDPDGDGAPDVSLAPLAKLVDAIEAAGAYAILSTETYGVGGGQIPEGFWKRHPDAAARDADGNPVKDDEYGFGGAVPSILHPEYQATTRRFIAALSRAIDPTRWLWFETTVEPQYMGNRSLDYTPAAKQAYEAWLRRSGTKGPAFPTAMPAPAAFRDDPVWNRFRALALAAWVSGDAKAFRDAGGTGFVAIDYLETGGGEMRFRNGDSLSFLTALTGVDIIQVNWHWHLASRAANAVAYDTVTAAEAERAKATPAPRPWAVMEHMTLNGQDYRPDEVAAMLRNTLARGTLLGWEFVNVAPRSADAFACYHDDWSPKPLIAEVDGKWPQWLAEIEIAAREP
ncbi:MAG: beta-galactosidase [Planctomycetes bacterium]|nr:beta-galactosidase [Planctomycetota bacterium]